MDTIKQLDEKLSLSHMKPAHYMVDSGLKAYEVKIKGV